MKKYLRPLRAALLCGLVLVSLVMFSHHDEAGKSSGAGRAAAEAARAEASSAGAAAVVAGEPTVFRAPRGVDFWMLAGEAQGEERGLEILPAAASRGRGVTPAGRRWQVAEFPDLRTLAEGRELSLQLPDGRSFKGVVNYSRRDDGYEDTHQVAVGFKGDLGGLVAGHDGVRRKVQGQLLVEGDRKAWTLEQDDAGTLWLVERWREDLVCEPPAVVAAAAPGGGAENSTGPAAEAARSSLLPGDNSVAPEAIVVPVLNSRPEATAVLYMDFDGEPTQIYPDWPLNNPATPIAAPASGLSAEKITEVWRRVAEDFIQFNINVSTELARYNAVSAGSRMRIIVANTLDSRLGGAGIAKMQSFRTNAVSGYSVSSRVPCWLPVTPNFTASAASITTGQLSSLASNLTHEFGHTLALWHDGNDGVQPSDTVYGNYYPGHGTAPYDWSPIMGGPYRPGAGSDARSILQWAKNDYPGANNSQDDLAVLAGTANGFGYAADEPAGFSIPALAATGTAHQVGGEGVIANQSDEDFWSFTVTTPGSTTLEVAPADTRLSIANLDCGFRIENSQGVQVGAVVEPADNMEARAVLNLAPGTYRVVAYGTGNKTWTTGGYDSYGSTGRYVVTVDLPSDAVDPVAVIHSPPPGVLGSAALTFSGTATDDTAVSALTLYMRRNGDNTWWDGTYWQMSKVSLTATLAAGAWSCTAPLPVVAQLNTGTYDFIAVAEDAEGHRAETTLTVTRESTGPVLAITSPLTVLSTAGYAFEGAVQDAQGVQSVNCYLQRHSDGQYWNGAGWGNTAVTLSSNITSSVSPAARTWNCTSPGLPQPGGQLTAGTYTFIAIAADRAGNASRRDSVVAMDNGLPPQVSVTAPGHSSLTGAVTAISGTATDASGIKDGIVNFTLYEASTGKFWNGTDWGMPTVSLQATVTGGTWSYTAVPAGSQLTNGFYHISASARDLADRLSASIYGVNQTSFRVDKDKPLVAITAPLTGTTVASLTSISGTASDNVSLATVRVYLYRFSDGKFWDGSAWGGSGSIVLPAQITGGTWTTTGPLPAPGANPATSLTDGAYDIMAFAVDTVGNQKRIDSVITVQTGTAPMQPDLVGWWQAEGNANDASGRQHTGGRSTDVSFAPGRLSQGFYFPGSDTAAGRNLVTIPDSTDFKAANLTVSAWVKFADTPSAVSGSCPAGQQYILTKQNSRTPAQGAFLDYALLKLPDGRVMFGADFGPGDDAAAISTTRVAAGTWYHLMGTYDHASFKIYVNGKLEGTDTETRNLLHASTPLCLGRTNASQYDGLFTGVMDEVKVYEVALTPEMIPALDPVQAGSGLVSWWPGNGSASDAQGTNHGTLQNGLSFTTGIAGQAFSTSPATGSHVSIPDSPSLRVKKFTIDAWVNFNALPSVAGHIFGKALGGADANSYILWYMNGALHGYTEGGPQLSYPWSPVMGQWYHVAYTFDGARQKLYVDGVQVADGANTAVLSYDNHPAIIGGDYSGPNVTYFFDGKIDEVDLFDRALSASEISAIYTAGAAGKSSAPSLTVTDAIAAPGAGSMTFTVAIARPGATAATVDYTTMDGTAIAGSDYTSASATLTIPALATSATITVPLAGNSASFLRTIHLQLSNPVNAVLNRAQATGTILLPPLPMPAGLVSWWRGDGSAGDSTGSNPGTLQNGTTFSTGKSGQAFDLVRASSHRVLIPDSPSLRVSRFTIDAWVNFASRPSVAHILAKTVGTGVYNSYVFWYQDGALRGYTEGPGRPMLVYPWTPEPGQWYHVAYTFDGARHKLYVDGAEVADGANTSVLTYDNHAVIIGADYANESITDHFDGKLDEVDLFDRALTASEIQAIYAAGTSGKSTAASLSVADATAAANSGSAVFQVTIAQPSASAMFVNYTTLNGTALAGTDYTAASGTLNIPANATSSTISVPLLNSALTSSRTFSLQLSTPVNAVINRAEASGTILPAPLPIVAGLVSWWPGNGNANDIQSSHHATPQNEAAYTTGKAGQAFSLDGVDDHLTTAAGSTDFYLDSGDFTIDGWIYTPTPVATMRLLSAGSTTAGPNHLWTLGYGGGWGGTRLNFYYWNGFSYQDATSSEVPLTANTWHHIAVTRTGATLNFYFDGAPAGSGGIGTIGRIANTRLILGARQINNSASLQEFANGRLDEVDLYRRALSAADINAIYQAQAAGKSTLPAISAADQAIAHDAASAVFQLSIARPAVTAISVNYTTADGTALAGRDYTAASGTLNIPANATSATITVPVLNSARTAPRAFQLLMSNATGALLHDFDATGNILPPPLPLTQNLLSWWPGNGNANDVQSSHHATPQNGAAYTTGKVGQAFSLDGVGDHLTTAASSDFYLNSGDFTIDGWIYTPTPAATMRLLSAGSTTAGPNHLWTLGYGSTGAWGSGTRLNFYYWNGSSHQDVNSSEVALTANTWHHIAVTRTGATLNFYFNGVPAGSAGIGTIGQIANTRLILGARQINNSSSVYEFANGRVDEVDLYKRALSAVEISALYQADASGKSTQAGIAIADVDIAPAATSAVFQVSIGRPSASAMSVDYTTVNGTALSTRDYTAISGTLSIPANATSATLTVPLLHSSTLTSERTFYMQLSNPVNAALADDQAAATMRPSNAVTGFSVSTNTAAQVWQYGHTAPDGTGFTLFTTPHTTPILYSWDTPGAGDMGIVFNRTGSLVQYNIGTLQPADQLALFPHGDGKKAVLRWKATAAGQYLVTGLFEGIESAGGATTTDVSIVLNGNAASPLLFNPGDTQGLNFLNGYQTRKPFSFSLTVAAGDTLDFRVGQGSNGYAFDGTGLKVTVANTTPPPQGAITFTATSPASVGGTMKFDATAPAGWTVRVQSAVSASLTESDWSDLNDGFAGRMAEISSGFYTLNTSAYPVSTSVRFRAVATRAGQTALISTTAGPYNLGSNSAASRLATWKQYHFPPGSPLAANDADPDGDNLSNLHEYAMGTDPQNFTPAPIHLAPSVGNFIEFHFQKDINTAADLQYIVEWSDDLQPGIWSSAGVSAASITTINGPIYGAMVFVPTSGTTRRFTRMRIVPQ